MRTKPTPEEEHAARVSFEYAKRFHDMYPNEPGGGDTLSTDEITALYEKCLRTGKPWQFYVKDPTADLPPDAIL